MSGDPPELSSLYTNIGSLRDGEGAGVQGREAALAAAVALAAANPLGNAVALPQKDTRGRMTKLCNVISNLDRSQQQAQRLLLKKNAKDSTKQFILCQGTTTRFGKVESGAPMCYHRQCNCIILATSTTTTYGADKVAILLSPEEIAVLQADAVWNKPFRICKRHNQHLTIPYAYLKVIITKKLTRDIKFVEEMKVKLSSLGSSDSNLIQQLKDMVEELKHMDTESAHMVHASILSAMYAATEGSTAKATKIIDELMTEMSQGRSQSDDGGINPNEFDLSEDVAMNDDGDP
jgi:hypothetical protein